MSGPVPRLRAQEPGRADRSDRPRFLQERSGGRGDRRLRGALSHPESKAGARAFPLILPTEPDAPGAAEGRRVADALREDERPTLVLWADSDPVLPFSVGEQVSERLGYAPPRKIANAGHFLQEDAGEEIGRIIAEWLNG